MNIYMVRFQKLYTGLNREDRTLEIKIKLFGHTKETATKEARLYALDEIDTPNGETIDFTSCELVGEKSSVISIGTKSV